MNGGIRCLLIAAMLSALCLLCVRDNIRNILEVALPS